VAFPMLFAHTSRSERRARARELLERVGLGDRMNHRPTELSGGQQQRVPVARALEDDPELIRADGPTGNLDSSSGYSVMRILAELHQGGRTILVVTHDPRMQSFASETAFMLDGKVVDAETYARATTAFAATAGSEKVS